MGISSVVKEGRRGENSDIDDSLTSDATLPIEEEKNPSYQR